MTVFVLIVEDAITYHKVFSGVFSTYQKAHEAAPSRENFWIEEHVLDHP